ncbi:MAG TPA: metallopeptidase TldD-related protein, partial [bacterium]|nr:metallopeptidase TldD-related protein [bacterium]
KYTHAEYTGYVSASVTRPDDQLEGYELFQSAEHTIDLEGPVGRLVEKMRAAEGGAALPSGNYPVLFTPNALSTFFALGNALNGKPVVEGVSTLRDALGQQALSTLLTITDDPTVPGGPQSYPLDDEGIPASPTPLVQRGVVRGFLFDLRWGTRHGQGSTGNGLRCGRTQIGAGRGYQNPVVPAPSNMVIEAGDRSIEELVRSIGRGLIVDSVMGVHTSNPISGDFSVNMDLALVVENGEVIGRLKDAMLSGNTFALLKDGLMGLSRERVWHGSSLTPWFLVDGLAVTTAG